MLKLKHLLINLTLVLLISGLAGSLMALQLGSRTSQGNSLGLTMQGGSNVLTGTHEFPRGSGNQIPTYEGGWGHFVSVVRDIDGDGTMEDTSYGRGRGRSINGGRASLEAYDMLLEGHNAGHRMDQWASRVENNEIWSSMDPDNVTRWPAEFREGRTLTGEPIMYGVETMGAFHTDAFNRSYHRSVPPPGVSLEYMFHFLNFGESNNMAYGHLFVRNMSEYLKWNDNTDFQDQVAATPDGQMWGGLAIMYVTNYWGTGPNAVSPDDGWAYHPAKGIIAMVDEDGLESSFTQGGMAFHMGYTMLRQFQWNGEETELANYSCHEWHQNFGFSTPQDIGTRSEAGWVHEWACAVQDQQEVNTRTWWFNDEPSPWTGRPAIGMPGMMLPGDEWYDRWVYGDAARMCYTSYAELHDIGPRDSTSCDFAIMFVYPKDPPFVMKPNDISYIFDEELQMQMEDMEQHATVAEVVYEGGYVVPATPEPPPLTVVPGDRQVTITWSRVNVDTPDPYYYFLQEHPEIDPNGVYREYDFEGYRLYRSYVGPSDAHAEVIWQSSLSEGNLAFSYIDSRDKDEPYYRMRNGMKVWYALVPYDRNYDPATGEMFSLPEPDAGKTWNRPFPEGYHTIRPRSNASNFESPTLDGEVQYVSEGAVEASSLTSVELSGDGSGSLTQAPAYIEPIAEFEFNPVIAEKITQEMSIYVRCSGEMPFNVKDPGCGNNHYGTADRVLQLLGSGGNVQDTPGPIPVRDYVYPGYAQINEADVTFNGGMSDEGIAYSISATFSNLWNGDMHYDVNAGGYTGGEVAAFAGRCWGGVGTAPGNQGYSRSARMVATWETSGSGMTLSVYDETRGVDVPFTPYIDEFGWGFITGGNENAVYDDVAVRGLPKSERTNLLEETVPQDNTEDFTIFLNGLTWGVTGGDDGITMPSAGTTFTFDVAFGSWNGDQTVFTQQPDPPFPGDKWRFDIQPYTMDPEDADLSKVRVVPNPYIASSFLDQSEGNRRIEFVNLPDKCTIRIYTLGGNLVNVLNHIGNNRFGWGDYVNVDELKADNTPYEFSGYDNHHGTEPWNLKNRFGQTVASGLYFFHVTDQRGETHTGKFYVVN